MDTLCVGDSTALGCPLIVTKFGKEVGKYGFTRYNGFVRHTRSEAGEK